MVFITVSIPEKHNFCGIKIHPVLDHYAVNMDAFDAVFSCARQHHWPILTHTDVDGTSMDAVQYEPMITAYPDVILILAHLRWGAIPLAKRYSNVLVDTTYVSPVTVEIGLDALGPEKIMFGSDAAEGFNVGRTPGRPRPRRSYRSLLDGLEARGITESALIQMCYLNARDLFNIKED